MVYCIKCGAKIPEKAEFCSKCGRQIKPSDEPKKEIKDEKSIEKKIEESAEDFGKKAEYFGKKIEKKAEQFGRQLEKKANNAGYYFNQWYDKTFKIVGPLIGAFIALIVMRIIIYIIQASNVDIFIVTAFSDGLLEYLLIIFASMLISGYNTYFHHKYKQQYQWIYPLISATGFIIGLWAVSKILLIIDQNDNTPVLAAIGNFINTYLIVIFILAVIIGYAVQFSVYSSKYREKSNKT
jgi:type II secretory pathway component PulF/ribosomal protein L40E